MHRIPCAGAVHSCVVVELMMITKALVVVSYISRFADIVYDITSDNDRYRASAINRAIDECEVFIVIRIVMVIVVLKQHIVGSFVWSATTTEALNAVLMSR